MNRITKLPSDCIFVFGSNLYGVHGRGAAKDAKDFFGAEMGKGYGLYGQSFAIPTKLSPHESLSLAVIQTFIEAFKEYAHLRPHLTFYVTPIGCGLAGYAYEDIAPMFEEMHNVIFTDQKFHALVKKSEYFGVW